MSIEGNQKQKQQNKQYKEYKYLSFVPRGAESRSSVSTYPTPPFSFSTITVHFLHVNQPLAIGLQIPYLSYQNCIFPSVYIYIACIFIHFSYIYSFTSHNLHKTITQPSHSHHTSITSYYFNTLTY